MAYENEMAKMGRPELPEDEKRSKTLPVIRVTPEEDAELRAGAIFDGKKLGAWLRELGLKRRRAQSRSK